MKKIISICIICLLTILLTGCGKSKIDSNKFQSVMEENGFTVESKLNDNISPEIKEMLVANKGDDFIFEYFVFENDEFAKKTFDSRKENLDNSSVKKSKLETNYNNYNKFALSANNRYYYIARIEDTIVLAISSDNNKKEIEDIIKKLGY